MGGPIVRTGTTPAFWRNWEKAFAKGAKSKSAATSAKADEKKTKAGSTAKAAAKKAKAPAKKTTKAKGKK